VELSRFYHTNLYFDSDWLAPRTVLNCSAGTLDIPAELIPAGTSAQFGPNLQTPVLCRHNLTDKAVPIQRIENCGVSYAELSWVVFGHFFTSYCDIVEAVVIQI
jgi:hypothetical protein